MKKNKIVPLSVLLILSIGNYFRLLGDTQIRLVDFISIFVIGLLSGILLISLIDKFKNNK